MNPQNSLIFQEAQNFADLILILMELIKLDDDKDNAFYNFYSFCFFHTDDCCFLRFAIMAWSLMKF